MDFRTDYNARQDMDLQYYSSNEDLKQNISNANPNGANSMTRNAMDSNYRHMANVTNTCLNNRDCMRVLYHNMYNTNKKDDLKNAMYGKKEESLKSDDTVAHFAKELYSSSIISNNSDNKTHVKPDNQYFSPLPNKSNSPYSTMSS